MNKVLKVNIIFVMTLFLGVLSFALLPSKAFASCEPNYGGGETCEFTEEFEVTKKVRFQGDSIWKDKVVGVKEGETVEFRIVVKNTGETSADNMKMTDLLPDALYRIGGAGLTEEWNDFEVDETKTFILEARIKSVEFDRENDFEKCVVNKAEAEQDGDLVGSDTATVCYGSEEITELPETGAIATETLSILGFASTGLGMILKRKR